MAVAPIAPNPSTPRFSTASSGASLRASRAGYESAASTPHPIVYESPIAWTKRAPGGGGAAVSSTRKPFRPRAEPEVEERLSVLAVDPQRGRLRRPQVHARDPRVAVHAPHLLGETQGPRRRAAEDQLEDEQGEDDEARAREPGVALEAPPRPWVRQRFAAAFAGAGAGAIATASVTPSTLPACAASATYRW